MKHLAILASAIALAAPAAASAVTPTHRAQQRFAEHIRKLELRNHFHLRDRVGGPFTLTHPYEDKTQWPWATFVYDAHGTTPGSDGQVVSCTIGLRIRGRANHMHYKRRVLVCAKSWPQS